MPTVIDGSGIWEDLGVVTPDPANWILFPYPCKTAFSTLKIEFIGDVNTWVYCWLRAVYQTQTGFIYDHRWRRLYPKPEVEILEYPYPQDLIKNPLPQRYFEIKKNLKSKYIGSAVYDPAIWSVRLLEKQDSLATTTPGGITIPGSVGSSGNAPPGIV